MRYLQGIATQPRLIIEVWTNHETSLGWTRYTPRIIYLLLLCYLLKQSWILVLNIV
ncbi:hypothetical protein Hanom_Chr14g01252081 [Helianthus anomalus]